MSGKPFRLRSGMPKLMMILRSNEVKVKDENRRTHTLCSRIGHRPYVVVASFCKQLYIPCLDPEADAFLAQVCFELPREGVLTNA